MNETNIEVKPERTAVKSSNSTNVEIPKQARKRIPYASWPRLKGQVKVTREELLDDLLDDFAIQEYSFHPGFPRTDAALERFRQFVYYDISKLGKEPITWAWFRANYKNEYRRRLISWFEEADWCRFPNALSKVEVDILSPDLKLKYDRFCKDISNEKRHQNGCEVVRYNTNRRRWKKIASGRWKSLTEREGSPERAPKRKL